jgi:hypothetical protein
MLKLLLVQQVSKLEQRFDYDAAYMHQMLEVSPGAFLKFSILTGLVDRNAASPEAIAAARIATTLLEDCGPCVQISVDMAAAEGVDPEILKAIVLGNEEAMGDDAALGWRFARACLARDMELADPLRDEIEARWGDRGVLAMSLAITTARMYPTVKYAMGFGKACSRVMVAGEALATPERTV